MVAELAKKSTKDEITGLALSLFQRRGYEGTSLNDIASTLDLTKGAIYHHFKNKEELFYSCLKKYFGQSDLQKLEAKILGKGLEKYVHDAFFNIPCNKEIIQKEVGSTEDNAILQFYRFLYEATRLFPEFQEKINQQDEVAQKTLAAVIKTEQEKGIIRRDIDPELTAFELSALVHQVLYLSFVNPKVKNDETLYGRMFENYWKRLVIPS